MLSVHRNFGCRCVPVAPTGENNGHVAVFLPVSLQNFGGHETSQHARRVAILLLALVDWQGRRLGDYNRHGSNCSLITATQLQTLTCFYVYSVQRLGVSS